MFEEYIYVYEVLHFSVLVFAFYCYSEFFIDGFASPSEFVVLFNDTICSELIVTPTVLFQLLKSELR